MQVFGGLAYCRSKSEVGDLLGDVGIGSEFAQPALDDIGSAERPSVGLACNAGPGQCCSLKTVEKCVAQHLMAAFRYVALNPVKAKLAATVADWSWSSTQAHLRRQDDGLVNVLPLLDRVESFADFLEVPAEPEQVAALTKGQTIGRPLMGDQELGELEKRLG